MNKQNIVEVLPSDPKGFKIKTIKWIGRRWTEILEKNTVAKEFNYTWKLLSHMEKAAQSDTMLSLKSPLLL